MNNVVELVKHSAKRSGMESAIINAVACPIVTLDDQGIVKTFNPAAARLFGYEPAEIVGREFLLLLDEPSQEQNNFFMPLWGQHSLSVNTWELTGRRKDGTTFAMELQMSATDLARRPFWVGIIHDISAARRVEEELNIAKEQAEAANCAKSEFLATMSHEIRTPLNAILGALSLLMDTALTNKQRSFTEVASESGKLLLTLINDILDFSKIEAGHLELEPVDFDILQMVESTAELMAPRAYSKHIEIASMVDPDVPHWLRADVGRLRQVLLNLISNAIKFTHQGGVAISVSLADADAEQVWLRFEVMDTGIGIPQDDHSRLFEKFSQGNPWYARRHGGTGLGLAISRHLAEILGGEIGFSSQEGQGSTFWFTVPCVRTVASQLKPATTGLAGRCILLVEANPVSRLIHERQLQTWDMQVTGVATGIAAMSLLHEAAERGKPFAAVIIDQHLPDMSGEELGIFIHRTPGLSGNRLVLMTNMCVSLVTDRIRKQGFRAWLTKPVRQSSLYRWLCVASGVNDADEWETEAQDEDDFQELVTPKSGRILLVEDSHVNQVVVKFMLTKVGYQVDAVGNGLEAVDAVRTLPYDLILMDLSMPELDGFEATMRIRQLPEPQNRVPIIAMTANVLLEDQERCLEVGMNGYLSKPIDQARLVAAVESWLPTAVSSPLQASTMSDNEMLDEMLNVKILQQLEKDIDPKQIGQVIGLFINEAKDRLSHIATARASEDWQRLQREAHALKSSAGTFGVGCLQDHASRLESACRTRNWEAALNLAESIDRVAAPALESLAHRYG